MKRLSIICLLLLSVMAINAAKLHRIEEKGKYGYADEAGNIVVKCNLTYAMDFSQGLAYVCRKFKILGADCAEQGFIDETGKFVIRISDGVGMVPLIDPANYKGDEIMFKDDFVKIPSAVPYYISLYQGVVESCRPRKDQLGNGGLEMLFQSNISNGIFDRGATLNVTGFKEFVDRGDVLIGVSRNGNELAFDKNSHFPYSSYYFSYQIENNYYAASSSIWTGEFGVVYATTLLTNIVPSPYLYTKYGESNNYFDSLNVLKFDNGDMMFVTYVDKTNHYRLLDKTCTTVADGTTEIKSYLQNKSYKLVEYKNLTSGPIVDCIKSAPVERVTDPSNMYSKHQTGSVWKKKDISKMILNPDSFSGNPLGLQIVNGFNGQRQSSKPVSFNPKKDNISDIIISDIAFPHIVVLNNKGKECKMEDFEITSSSDKVEIKGNDIKLNVTAMDVVKGKVEKEYDVTVKHIASGVQTTIKIAPMFVDSIKDNRAMQTYVFTEIPGETRTDYAICYKIDTKEYEVVKMPFKINAKGKDGANGGINGNYVTPGQNGGFGANLVVYMSKYFKEHFGEQSLKIETDGGKGGKGGQSGSVKADDGKEGEKGVLEFVTLK